MRRRLAKLIQATFALLCALGCTFGFVGHATATELGAGLHLGQGKHEASMALASLRVLGLSSFRDEIYWSRFEDIDGNFRVDRIPGELRKALTDPRLGPKSMVILGYGNDRYDGGGRPVTDRGRTAFARYALEVARNFPQIGYLELWNEWNHAIGVKDGSKGNAEDYLRLVSVVAPALRNSGTKSKIVVGGLADDLPDWPFAQALVQKGILKYADAFSVHLYNYSAGGRAVPQEMFDRLKRLQEILRAGNGGKDFPIMVTEMGWPTHEGKLGTSEAQSGAFISQFMFEATGFPWLHGVWIYELFNSGKNSNEREHNFGILKGDGAVKAGTCTIRESLDLLKNAQFVERGTTKGRARWIRFRGIEKSFVIVYSPDRNGEHEALVALGASNSIRSTCGETAATTSATTDGWVTRKIANTPTIVWLDQTVGLVSEVIR